MALLFFVILLFSRIDLEFVTSSFISPAQKQGWQLTVKRLCQRVSVFTIVTAFSLVFLCFKIVKNVVTPIAMT